MPPIPASISAAQQMSQNVKILPLPFSARFKDEASVPFPQNNTFLLSQANASLLHPPNNAGSNFVCGPVMNCPSHGNGSNQVTNWCTNGNAGVLQPFNMQAGPHSSAQIQQLNASVESAQHTPFQVAPLSYAIQNGTGTMNTSTVGAVNGVGMHQYSQGSGGYQQGSSAQAQSAYLPMVMIGDNGSLQGVQSGLDGHTVRVMPACKYQCRSSNGCCQTIIVPQMQTFRHSAHVQQCQNLAFMCPPMSSLPVPGNQVLDTTASGQAALSTCNKRQESLVSTPPQMQTPVQASGELPATNMISVDSHQMRVLDANGGIGNVKEFIGSNNHFQTKSQEVNTPMTIPNEQQKTSEITANEETCPVMQNGSYPPSQNSSDTRNLKDSAASNDKTLLGNFQETSETGTQEAPTRTDGRATFKSGNGRNIGIPPSLSHEKEAQGEEANALERRDTHISQSGSGISTIRLEDNETAARALFPRLESVENIKLPLAPMSGTLLNYSGEYLALNDDHEVQELRKNDVNPLLLLENTDTLKQVVQDINNILQSSFDSKRDSNHQRVNTERSLVTQSNANDGILLPDSSADKESSFSVEPLGAGLSSAQNFEPFAATNSSAAPDLGPLPQKKSSSRTAEQKDAREAFLNYNWKDMSPAARRKRRVRIRNCKRLSIAERRIIRHGKRGEQPIEYRSLTNKEVTELSKDYPTIKLKRDKKTRNRMIAQNSRDQVKETKEGLQKENKILRSQIAQLASRQKNSEPDQVSGVSILNLPALVENFMKMKELFNGIASDQGAEQRNSNRNPIQNRSQDVMMNEVVAPALRQDDMEIHPNE